MMQSYMVMVTLDLINETDTGVCVYVCVFVAPWSSRRCTNRGGGFSIADGSN